MGYYVRLMYSNVQIEADQQKAADKALREMNYEDTGKKGVSGTITKQDAPHPDKWWPWMPWNYHDTSVCEDLSSILEVLGFETRLHDDDQEHCCAWHYREGHERIEPRPTKCFWGDSALSIDEYDDKMGAELDFFKTLAPFISTPWSDDPSMEWLAEDGMRYRWLFQDGKLIEQNGRTVWGNTHPSER